DHRLDQPPPDRPRRLRSASGFCRSRRAVADPPGRRGSRLMLASACDLDRIDLAPFAQCPLGGLRFEIVPSLKDLSSYYQGPEFPVAAFLAEHVSDLVEVTGQNFTCNIQ